MEVALLLNSSMPGTPVVLYTMFDEVFGGSPARTSGIAAIVAKNDAVANWFDPIEALLNTANGSPSKDARSSKRASELHYETGTRAHAPLRVTL